MAMACSLAGAQLCHCSSSSGVGTKPLPADSHRLSMPCASPTLKVPLRSSRSAGGRPCPPRLMLVVSASSAGGGGGIKQENQRDEKRSSPATAPVPPTTAANAVDVPGTEDSEQADAGSSIGTELDEISRSEEEIARAQKEVSDGRDGSAGSSGSSAEERSPDEIGKALSELRKARAAALGAQDPSLTTDFWKGVVEETRQIEWPGFSKILGTTGVVLAMILGSSVVLLTVNAILSASSDYLFNDPSFQSFAKSFLNLSY